MASKQKTTINITHRAVNTKRHTVGYVVNNRIQKMDQMRKWASEGRIPGVRVVGNHIQAIPNERKPLSELPERFI
jgi:hypothetical protein